MQIVSCLLNASNGFMGFYGFPGMFYRMDPTYSLVIIGAVICMIGSANVNRAFRKYSRYGNDAGIYDVQIRHISGNLTDNYNPGNKTLNLSDSVYGSTSIAAVGVAAHECGHAIQHNVGYIPIKIRGAIVPVVNLGSKLSWPVIILGVILGSFNMLNIGILLFALTLVFQIHHVH